MIMEYSLPFHLIISAVKLVYIYYSKNSAVMLTIDNIKI